MDECDSIASVVCAHAKQGDDCFAHDDDDDDNDDDDEDDDNG